LEPPLFRRRWKARRIVGNTTGAVGIVRVNCEGERERTGLGTAEVVDYDVKERYAICGGKTMALWGEDREEVKELIPEEIRGEVIQEQME
jgi:hypothetical protein